MRLKSIGIFFSKKLGNTKNNKYRFVLLFHFIELFTFDSACIRLHNNEMMKS